MNAKPCCLYHCVSICRLLLPGFGFFFTQLHSAVSFELQHARKQIHSIVVTNISWHCKRACPFPCRLSQMPSRLGPSRMQAQPSPLPQIRYLDSAPALMPAQPAAASTSHSTHHTPVAPFLSAGYYAESPGPNNTPYTVQNQAELPEANGVDGLDTEDQQSHERGIAPSPVHDRMFAYTADNGMHANGTSANGGQLGRSEQGLSDASNGQAKPQYSVDNSRRSVIKRLAAKRHAMSGFVSPAHGFQSPSSIGLSSGAAPLSQSVSEGVTSLLLAHCCLLHLL